MTDDRESFRVARIAGKAAAHEKRLESATYTAAEVKVLTEAALRLGRKEAFDEVADALDAAAVRCAPGAVREELKQAAQNFRSLASHSPQDATSGRIDPEEGE